MNKSDKTFWLCYSANWSEHIEKGGNPPGSNYALCLREMKLLDPKRRSE